jgi:superfamily II DNA/RNA helicase
MSYQNFSRGRNFTRTRAPQRYQRKPNNNRRGKYIDPRRFVQAATAVEEKTIYEPKNKFSDFQIDALLKNNLKAKGYELPSPIQDQAIPVALEGRDVIGIADTGTGKTAAFAVPLLQKLISQPGSGALIVAPTRELALQIEEECRSIARGSGLSGAVLIGGSSMSVQLRDLRRRPRIIIGTPGRIEDHLNRRTLSLSKFNFVVLDEVDRMLDMGFIQPMRNILGQLNPDRQSLFFSATMDSKVKSLIETFSSDAVCITLSAPDVSKNVDQNVVHYSSPQEKISKLHELLISDKVAKAIIFDETQRSVERLQRELHDRGFSSDAIHGGKNQAQRQRALGKFKANAVNILVATDVAARGIDVVDITHVINYSIPQTYEDYTHRVGRAGRAGRTGYALTFVNQTNY